MDMTTQQSKGKAKSAKLTETADEVTKPQPVRQDYSLAGVPETAGEEASEPYFSVNRNLTLYLSLKVTLGDGSEAYQPATVAFRNGGYTTSDPAVIEALNTHPSFGGSHIRRFEDKPKIARNPLFFHGSLPDYEKKRIKDEEESLTRDRHRDENPFEVKN